MESAGSSVTGIWVCVGVAQAVKIMTAAVKIIVIRNILVDIFSSFS
jgi:hypothetical protein